MFVSVSFQNHSLSQGTGACAVVSVWAVAAARCTHQFPMCCGQGLVADPHPRGCHSSTSRPKVSAPTTERAPTVGASSQGRRFPHTFHARRPDGSPRPRWRGRRWLCQGGGHAAAAQARMRSPPGHTPPQHYRPAGDGRPHTRPDGPAQEGRRGARRPLAGVSVQLVLRGTRLGHPQEQSTVVAFLFVVLQTCIRYLVKREIPDLEKSIP